MEFSNEQRDKVEGLFAVVIENIDDSTEGWARAVSSFEEFKNECGWPTPSVSSEVEAPYSSIFTNVLQTTTAQLTAQNTEQVSAGGEGGTEEHRGSRELDAGRDRARQVIMEVEEIVGAGPPNLAQLNILSLQARNLGEAVQKFCATEYKLNCKSASVLKHAVGMGAYLRLIQVHAQDRNFSDVMSGVMGPQQYRKEKSQVFFYIRLYKLMREFPGMMDVSLSPSFFKKNMKVLIDNKDLLTQFRA